MKYNISKPSSELKQYVKHYWSLRNCLSADKNHIHRIIPNGLIELIFYFEDKPLSGDKEISINENTLLTGQLSKYYDLTISGNLNLFSILFKPHGISAFLNIPLIELQNQNIPLKYLLKGVDDLECKLYEADSFGKRVEIAESYLLKLKRNNKNEYNFQRINESVYLINNSRGMIDIDTLASKACYSRRQFERVFSDFVGISPKQFLKIVRFQNAIHVKSNNFCKNLTELTYRTGYYDQSHMINDFKHFSGLTPKQYFGDSENKSDYFTNE